MTTLLKYLCLLIAVFMFFNISAQNELLGISITNSKIEVKDTKLYVNFDIDISGLNIKSNQGVALTPIINSIGIEKVLPKVIINGRNQQISYNRDVNRKNNFELYNDLYKVVIFKKNNQSIISYRVEVPFEAWMEGSNLSIEKYIYCSCNGNVAQNISNQVLSQNIKSFSHEALLLTYISPNTESLKNISDSISYALYFPIGGAEILPNYSVNQHNIDQTNSMLINNDIVISSINIIGATSPDGTFQYNEQLAKQRAFSLMSFLSSRYSISSKLYKTEWIGEDWNCLLKLVQQSDMIYKRQVIDIIKNTDVFAGREKKLMELNSGKVYQYMQEHFFPQLRNASYAVYYQPTSFDVAKGRELITTNPQSLSVIEMLLVADSYPHNSIGYKNAIEIAAKMYPEDMIANVNASSIALSNGDISIAKQHLERFNHQPDAWNNLGVIYMMEGNYESAQQYFQKAISAGNIEAVHNMEELNKRRGIL